VQWKKCPSLPLLARSQPTHAHRVKEVEPTRGWCGQSRRHFLALPVTVVSSKSIQQSDWALTDETEYPVEQPHGMANLVMDGQVALLNGQHLIKQRDQGIGQRIPRMGEIPPGKGSASPRLSQDPQE